MKYFNTRVHPAEVNITEATNFIRILTRLTGAMLHNIRILPDNEVVFEISWIGVLACFTWNSLFVMATYLTIAYEQTVLGILYESLLKKNGEYIETSIACITVLYACSSLVFSKHAKTQFWSNVLNIDDDIRTLGIRVDCSNLKRRLQWACIAHCAVGCLQGLISYFILSSWNQEISLSRIYHLVYSFNIILHSQLQYCFAAMIMECRFWYLNEVLRSILRNVDNIPSLPMVTVVTNSNMKGLLFSHKANRAQDKINSVGKIYSKLHAVAQETDKQFGNIIVLIICLGFITIILHTFYLMEAIAGGLYNDSRRFWFFVGYNGDYIACAVFFIYSIVNACERVYKETSKMAGITHRIIQDNMSDEVTEEASHLSLQLLHQKQKFTANGLFELNKSLLLSLLGSITTYLVILLQFATSSTITFKDDRGMSQTYESSNSSLLN